MKTFDPTIKLEVEIKDGQFLWSYSVGGSKQTSVSHLTVDNLAAFTDLLRYCRKVSWPKSEEDGGK